MSTGDDPDSLQLAQAFVQGFVTENYINFAILAVLLHDTVAYFEKEVQYFWAKPKSSVSILYFVSRYGSILAIASDLLLNFFNLSERMCKLASNFYQPYGLREIIGRMFYVQEIVYAIITLCIDYILLLRVCALYSRGRMITRALFSIFGLDALATMGIAIHGTIVARPFVLEIYGLSICNVYVPSSAEVILSWSIPLAFGTLLMVLAVYKARQLWKESAGFEGLDLVKVLIRDQIFYFLAVNVVCIAEILTNTVELSSLGGDVLLAVGNTALLSLVGSRLLFNMKEAGEKGLSQGTSCTIKSNIEFAAPHGGVAGSSLGAQTESLEAEI